MKKHVTALIALGCLISAPVWASNDGESPLHQAASRGDLAQTQALVDSQHIDVNITDRDRETPLHDAADNGHINVAKFLILRGANVNARDEDDKTPLHEAADDGNLEMVKLLVEKGADVNAKDNENETPLHEAKNKAVRDYLISKGAR